MHAGFGLKVSEVVIGVNDEYITSMRMSNIITAHVLLPCSGYVTHGALFKTSSDSLPAMAAEGSLYSSGIVSGDLQEALAWLSALLHELSQHLDKDCFRQAWGAAAAAINR